MTKKQKITKGSILEINIENKYYVYAQILGKAAYAFFDYKTDERLENYNILLNKPVLFITNVYDEVINQGQWLKVGNLKLREDLKQIPLQFIQDAIHPDKFELYNPNTGEISSATLNQIKGLERAAVWEANHLEDRIRDYYNNVPCIWLQEDNKLFKN